MRNKGYFYTLDVVVGLIIIVLGMVLLADLYFFTPQKEKTEAISTDVIGVLSAVTISDVCPGIQSYGCSSCNYNSIAQLCTQGQLKNPRISILDLFGQLYYDNRRGYIDNIVQEMIIDTSVVPLNFNLEIILYDQSDPTNLQQIYPAIPGP
jgi:hypothetical protein